MVYFNLLVFLDRTLNPRKRTSTLLRQIEMHPFDQTNKSKSIPGIIKCYSEPGEPKEIEYWSTEALKLLGKDSNPIIDDPIDY